MTSMLSVKVDLCCNPATWYEVFGGQEAMGLETWLEKHPLIGQHLNGYYQSSQVITIQMLTNEWPPVWA